jgi:SAM-dependent methyltransferase
MTGAPPALAAGPSDLLERVLDFALPPGPALVIATGHSAAPIALAAAGRQVDAIDVSVHAIDALDAVARRLRLADRVHARVADAEVAPFSSGYAVVVAERFWSASVFDRAAGALRAGGVLAWSTLHDLRPDSRSGNRWVPPPHEPAARLAPGMEVLLTDVVDSGQHRLRRLIARRVREV